VPDIETLARDVRALLQAEPGRAGRERVRARLEQALRDPDFVAAYAGPGEQSPRRLLYEDPGLGFCILVHASAGPPSRPVPPHDHGASWAIYGQAAGSTEMTDYVVQVPPGAERPGRVVAGRTYVLAPGDAHVYHEGDVHAPRWLGATRLVRIEGCNLAGIARPRYELAAD
jgi:hypothetical protein